MFESRFKSINLKILIKNVLTEIILQVRILKDHISNRSKMEAVQCVLGVCVLRALCLYRQLLFCYPNKQEFTSLLSFLSHCLVSLATVSDKLRGGLTPSREPILSHPKFVSLWVM